MHIEDNEGSVYIVPPSKRDQSLIVFGRGQARVTTSRESDDDLEPPQFVHYAAAHNIMKRMRYNLNHGDGLNFSKERRIPLQPFVPEGKPVNYYDRTREGWNMPPPPYSESESDESLPSQSSDSSSWDSDISVGVIFEKLFANMTSISQAEQDKDIEPFDVDLRAQQLDLQWKKCFEQHEPPKVIQVDVGNQPHLKLISISESLSPTEK